jgi:nucleoside phosphorylase/tetratricopeptide (TPR) repeat protein
MAAMETDHLDVLIVTAVPEEYAAVLAAGGGEAAWSTWEASTGVTVATQNFDVPGGVLHVGVTQALGMGAAQAVIAAAELIKQHDVQCLAMCGVCAGRRGDVALGDVIIADRVWQYGAGKRKAETVAGQRVVKEEDDIEMYRLHPPVWKQAAERFQVDREAGWLKRRPRSYEAQGEWLLERVLRGADPVTDAQSTVMCPDFDKAIERLWKKGWLADGTTELTEEGRKHIQRVRLLNRGKLPEDRPLAVHVGPIASGSQVMADDEVFARLSASVRKVLGVEMEAAAIGALGWAKGLPYSVVMKAVMDHADADKSDNFKAFAARASAEVLLAFVRENVPPRVKQEDDPVLDPGTMPLPKKHGPAALLNARHEVVGFHGREDLLGELRAWCEGGDKGSVRLIHAAGGMGKTRLAIELCRQMRGEGWRAGFLLEGDRVEALMESGRPVLAVVDYAESRPELKEMLRRVASRRVVRPPRFLLLARNADEWWADLLRADGAVKALVSGEEPIELASVTPERATIFRAAVRAFGGGEYEGREPSLADGRYARVLYVHAAALAAAQGREVTIETLMEDTLDHEERFWREQIESVDVDDMRRVVADLTLKGGATSTAELISAGMGKKMAMLLRHLYPGRPPKQISGLEPDLLGEAMVLRTLRGEGAGARRYLDRVFEGAEGEAIRTGFTVLGRLSEDHTDARGWIAQVLDGDVAGRALDAFAATKTVGERTAHAAIGMVLAEALEREGTIEIAEHLEKKLPHPDQTVSLREVGRWVLSKRLAHLPEGMDKERARLLNNLGNWQNTLGQREAALASTQEAVGLYRKLAAARPEAFLPDLASSLNNLGNRQSDLGQHEAALASTQEAVDLYRKLAAARPEAFLPDLAMSLSNLGTMQSALGKREAALASTQEAVDLYRKLAATRPKAFLPDLAGSLNNLGNRQSALGQREAALASTQEAVDLRRKLAAARPEAFLPDLAMSLNNLGNWQSALGQREAALASTQEAVDLYRKLAATRPEAFLPDLAMSLHNLSVDLADHGHPEAALVASQEALDALWPLYLRLPPAFAIATGDYLATLRRRLTARSLPLDLLDRIATYTRLTGHPPPD